MPSSAAVNAIYRVIKLDDGLRKACLISRQKTGCRVADQLAEAIEKQLPKLVAEVLALGFRPLDKKARPARLPLNQELLSALADASRVSGMDQSALLLAALRRQVGPIKSTAKRGKKGGGK